jgi:carbon storage regulator
MLVLSRREGESIVIGNRDIIVTLIEIRGEKVRIGVEASKEYPVHREEVYDAVIGSGQSVANVSVTPNLA